MELSSSEAGSGVDAFHLGARDRALDFGTLARVGDAVTDTSANSRDRDGSR